MSTLEDQEHYYSTNYLEHYGIKGMRWGIRRERGPDGTVGGGGKKETAVKVAKATGRGAAATGRAVSKAAKATGRGTVATGRAVKGAVDKHNQKKFEKAEKRARVEQAANMMASKNSKKSVKPKKLADMSNEELGNVIKRLQMEKQYIELTTTPKKEKKPGLASKLIKESGDVLLKSTKTVATAQLTKRMNTALNQRIAESDAAKAKKARDSEIARIAKTMPIKDRVVKPDGRIEFRDYVERNGIVYRGQSAKEVLAREYYDRQNKK